MSLVLILNLVLALMIVSAIVALHAKAILTDRAGDESLTARARSPRTPAPESRPPRQRATRTLRQPAATSG
ncbi:MAG TPA: hypothetical protein VMD09_09045 [Solirubrobacteraceae bacterium]|nr:hypothetical protein [Solirubrobacteraceae bacterium]